MRKFRILVVDDNQELCTNMQDILELSHYAVATARDGFQALDVAGRIHPDLVLLDMKMPVMDGLETYRRMKHIAPGTVVILMTAYPVEDLIRQALDEGASGWLRKPVDISRLLEAIGDISKRGGMVLLVDADRDMCVNIKDVLREKGFEVSVPPDGEAAIRMASEDAFDVMLLDVKLPPTNGLEIYRAVRKIRRDAAVIIAADYVDDLGDLVQQAVREGAYTCLEKPVDMGALIALMDWVKKQKAKSALEQPEV